MTGDQPLPIFPEAIKENIKGGLLMFWIIDFSRHNIRKKNEKSKKQGISKLALLFHAKFAKKNMKFAKNR